MELVGFWNGIVDTVSSFLRIVRPADIIDILIVAYLLYKAAGIVRETRAQQLVKGLFILVVVMQLSHWLNLNTISYILRNTMQVGVVALLVVFQPELRRALEKVGRRSNISNFFVSSQDDVINLTNEIAEAADFMSKEKIGALIVLERETRLGDVINSGTTLNAACSAPLLINIFIPNTPLHDGAVIVRGTTIAAAACILPLTHNDSLSRELGTRHRAALGVTENSDCVVVVVSEETGKISVAVDGNMTRNLSKDNLKDLLRKLLLHESDKDLNDWRDKLKWIKK
ncbi:MAG: diadenylate cyclase CdaA [Clostridia bacterium]|nr:diadenylate cyclase CdaA [Clostridia bacterium]